MEGLEVSATVPQNDCAHGQPQGSLTGAPTFVETWSHNPSLNMRQFRTLTPGRSLEPSEEGPGLMASALQ